MISSHTCNIPKDVVFPRLLFSDSRCFQAGHWRSHVLLGLSSAIPDLSLVLPDLSLALPHLLSALPGLTPALPGAPKCTESPQWSKIGDLLGGHEHTNLEDVCKRDWICTSRLWWIKLIDALQGPDGARLQMLLGAMIDWNWRVLGGGWSGGSWSGGSRSGWRHNESWDWIHWLVCNCENVVKWVPQGLPRDERLAGSGR